MPLKSFASASAKTELAWYPVMQNVSRPCSGQIGTPAGLSSVMRARQFTKSGTRSPWTSVYIGCAARYVSHRENVL